jgi:hypothetical protein
LRPLLADGRFLSWREHLIDDRHCRATIRQPILKNTGAYSQNPRDRDGENTTAKSVCGRIAWFKNPKGSSKPWSRHDNQRTKRGMYDGFAARDMDGVIPRVLTYHRHEAGAEPPPYQ